MPSRLLSLHAGPANHSSSERAAVLFEQHLQQQRRMADRIFTWLLVLQWAAAIIVSAWISPRTWAGESSTVHFHVWLAVMLGSALTSFPLYLALRHPGETLTRYAVTVGQMLMGALLIHLTGGRIETHFHVFGSLALLVFYRDTNLLTLASAIVAGDHLFRGVFFPASVFGTETASYWRTAEHTLWVVFENIFLSVTSRQSVRFTQDLARQQAELEATNEQIEERVRERTRELAQSEAALRESETRHRRLFEDSPSGIYRSDAAGVVLMANPKLVQMLGYDTGAELSSANIEAGGLQRVVDHEAFLERIEREGEVLNLETAWIRRDGTRISVRESARAIRDEQGRTLYFDGTIEDITERKLAEEFDQQRNRILEMVARNEPLSDTIALIADAVGQRSRQRCSVDVRSRADLGERVAGSRSVWPNEVVPADERQTCWAVPILSGSRELLGSIALSSPAPRLFAADERDLLETAGRMAALAIDHLELCDRLSRQARYDGLTGLPNRLSFQEHLIRALGQAKREKRHLGLLWIDLDRFKQVNDVLGHYLGDCFLQQVASRLSGAVPAGGMMARLSGDEFAVVLPTIEETADAEEVAARLLDSLSEPIEVQGHELFSSASIGIALYPEAGLDSSTLQRHADRAMYQAKSRGRNRYECFSNELSHAVAQFAEMENYLHRALTSGLFELHYQPQYRMDGSLEGCEALLRLRHADMGLVLPSQFILVAEETGLIVPIGTWVLREACRQSREWQREGCTPVRVAVNVSALQFTRSDFADTVASILAETGLDSHWLELELTETLVMSNLEESSRQMERLRSLGVRLSVDDFGTGYSSLSYLHRLPIDCLKIDRSFVSDMLSTAGTGQVVSAIIALSHSLGLHVVAEGVETSEQCDALRAANCDVVQGYLFDYPLPAEQMKTLLSKGTAADLHGLRAALQAAEEAAEAEDVLLARRQRA